jgi:hypothetical protein
MKFAFPIPAGLNVTLRTLAFSLLSGLSATSVAGAWPILEHPQHARIEPIGDQLRLNGTPMRISRVLTALPVSALATHYRKVLGKPLADAEAGGAQVLAQGRGDFFITITIQPQPEGGSEALVAVADSQAGHPALARPIGLALPANSTLISDLESIDGETASRQLVIANAHGLRTNLDHLSDSLAQRGLHPDGPPLAGREASLVQAFRGASGEARIVLVRREATTHAVLTLLSRRP